MLRARAGAWTVLLSDSLSMAAASSAVGLSPQQAAVRALQAGADSAMVCTGAGEAVLAVTAALDDGSLPGRPPRRPPAGCWRSSPASGSRPRRR